MADPRARFIISADDKASAALRRVKGQVDDVGKAFQSVRRLAALALGGITFRGLVDQIREVEVLRASLETATGSVAKASAEFDKLAAFAARTPFSVNETVDAFVKLKNLGLDPSIEALQSYGNTAAATGKSLNQFIEAVADASVGEFERLKEFGIKAKSQGDQVAFTFRGTTTIVRKSANEIEGYLRKIGQTEFAGAIEKRAQTLDGALSNLGDSFSQLAISIGDAGLTELLVSVARKISEIADVAGDAVTALRGFFDLSTQAESVNKINARLAALRGELEVIERITKSGDYWKGLDSEKRAAFLAKEAELLGQITYFENRRSRILAERQTPQAERPAAPVEDGSKTKTDKVGDYIRKLREEAETLGYTKQELVAYELAKLGANESTIRLAQGLQQEIEAFDAIAEAEKETARIFEESEKAAEAYRKELEQFADALTRSVNPAQDVADELAKIEEAFKKNLISADTYAEGVFRAMEKIEGKVEESTDKTKSLAEELGLSFSSAFEDAIVNGEKLSDVLKALEQDIIRIVTRKLVTEPLANAVGGFLDSFKLPGFASGGSFDIGAQTAVGALPGRDNRLIMFAGRDGERVTVEPPGQRGGGVSVVMNISTPDANSFRASRGQIEHQVRQLVRRAARND